MIRNMGPTVAKVCSLTHIAEKCIRHHRLRTLWQTCIGLSAAQAQSKPMSKNRFPPAWIDVLPEVRRLIAKHKRRA